MLPCSYPECQNLFSVCISQPNLFLGYICGTRGVPEIKKKKTRFYGSCIISQYTFNNYVTVSSNDGCKIVMHNLPMLSKVNIRFQLDFVLHSHSGLNELFIISNPCIWEGRFTQDTFDTTKRKRIIQHSVWSEKDRK